MLPAAERMCDPNLTSTAVGVVAPNSPCKQCVNRLVEEANYKYVSFIAESTYVLMDACADGIFAGPGSCKNCELMSWAVDTWWPSNQECCSTDGALSGCSEYVTTSMSAMRVEQEAACDPEKNKSVLMSLVSARNVSAAASDQF